MKQNKHSHFRLGMMIVALVGVIISAYLIQSVTKLGGNKLKASLIDISRAENEQDLSYDSALVPFLRELEKNEGRDRFEEYQKQIENQTKTLGLIKNILEIKKQKDEPAVNPDIATPSGTQKDLIHLISADLMRLEIEGSTKATRSTLQESLAHIQNNLSEEWLKGNIVKISSLISLLEKRIALYSEKNISEDDTLSKYLTWIEILNQEREFNKKAYQEIIGAKTYLNELPSSPVSLETDEKESEEALNQLFKEDLIGQEEDQPLDDLKQSLYETFVEFNPALRTAQAVNEANWYQKFLKHINSIKYSEISDYIKETSEELDSILSVYINTPDDTQAQESDLESLTAVIQGKGSTLNKNEFFDFSTEWELYADPSLLEDQNFQVITADVQPIDPLTTTDFIEMEDPETGESFDVIDSYLSGEELDGIFDEPEDELTLDEENPETETAVSGNLSTSLSIVSEGTQKNQSESPEVKLMSFGSNEKLIKTLRLADAGIGSLINEKENAELVKTILDSFDFNQKNVQAKDILRAMDINDEKEEILLNYFNTLFAGMDLKRADGFTGSVGVLRFGSENCPNIEALENMSVTEKSELLQSLNTGEIRSLERQNLKDLIRKRSAMQSLYQAFEYFCILPSTDLRSSNIAGNPLTRKQIKTDIEWGENGTASTFASDENRSTSFGSLIFKKTPLDKNMELALLDQGQEFGYFFRPTNTKIAKTAAYNALSRRFSEINRTYKNNLESYVIYHFGEGHEENEWIFADSQISKNDEGGFVVQSLNSPDAPRFTLENLFVLDQENLIVDSAHFDIDPQDTHKLRLRLDVDRYQYPLAVHMTIRKNEADEIKADEAPYISTKTHEQYLNRFADSFVSGDFDGDGALDLAVGAPGDLNEQGKVYIFLNKKKSYVSAGGAADVIIQGTKESAFGSMLKVEKIGTLADTIDDLFIGAPLENNGRGRVYKFNGRTNWNDHYDSIEAEDILNGQTEKSLFGSSMWISGDKIFIGAPQANGGDGTVLIYKLENNHPIFVTQLNGVPASRENFGASITGNEEYLMIGAPEYLESQGRVYELGLNQTESLSFSWNRIYEGEKPGSRFGSSIAINENYRMIGAPEILSGQGAVYLYQSNSDVPVIKYQGNTNENFGKAIQFFHAKNHQYLEILGDKIYQYQDPFTTFETRATQIFEAPKQMIFGKKMNFILFRDNNNFSTLVSARDLNTGRERILNYFEDPSPAAIFGIDEAPLVLPEIKSTSHPDPESYYNFETAYLEWGMDGVEAASGQYFYCLDKLNICNPAIEDSDRILSNITVSLGENYLRVKNCDLFGCGPIASYKFLSDTTKPEMPLISCEGMKSGETNYRTQTYCEWNDTTGPSEGLFKYCVDSLNTCTPDLESADRKVNFTHIDPGVQYLRVKNSDSAGESEISIFELNIIKKPSADEVVEMIRNHENGIQSNITELTDERSWNTTEYKLPSGQIAAVISQKWIHYLDENGMWEDISPEFTAAENGFEMNTAPFKVFAPRYAGGEARFISDNRFDPLTNQVIATPPFTQTLQAKGVENVEGHIEEGDLGYGNSNYVVYENAYPNLNADLIYYVHDGQIPELQKLVRFNSVLTPAEDLRLEFEMSFSEKPVIEKEKTQIDEKLLNKKFDELDQVILTEKQNPLSSYQVKQKLKEIRLIQKQKWDEKNKLVTEKSISHRPISDPDGLRGVGLKDFYIWDSGENQLKEPIQIEYQKNSNGFKLTKILPKDFFSRATYPIYTDTTSTFYPDPSTGATTVDGRVARDSVDETFSTIRNGSGTSAVTTGASVSMGGLIGSTTSDQFSSLARGIFTFDTSSLGASANINSATLSVYGYSNSTGLGNTNIEIVSSSPAANNSLVAADYSTLGSTSYGNLDIGSASTSAYNDISLNASGISNIAKTGITKLGSLLSWDLNGSFTGTWSSAAQTDMSIYNADESGTSNDPKLTVVYTNPNSAPSLTSVTDDTSTTTSPTNNGSSVTFTATATDPESDNYYLIVCDSGSTITANNEAAPTCSGTQICVSNAIASASQASCSATANTSAETVDWTSFVCDHNVASACSSAENTNSPYGVNHRPSFSSVTTDDGSAGTIEPGDTVRVQATLADTDVTPTQDDVTMVICQNGDTFNYASPGNGTTTSGCSSGLSGEYCRSTTAAPGTHSCNLPASLTSIPTAHGNYGFEVFVYDQHNFDATTSSSYAYAVQDVVPVVDSITLTGDGTGNFDLTAAGTTAFAWSAAAHDDNGDNDPTSTSGKIFNSGVTTNACTANDQNCYIQNFCTFSDLSTPGSGKTATGTDANVTISCSKDIQFIATASSIWKGYVSVTDQAGSDNLESSNSHTVNALAALDIRNNSDAPSPLIAFPYLAPGQDTGSTNQITYIANVGNQVIDINMAGSNLCNNWGTPYTQCNGSIVPVENMKFGTTAFTYNSGGTNLSDVSQCLDTNIAVRTTVSNSSGSIPIYWGIKAQTIQPAGNYTGQNQVLSTTSC